MAEIAEHCRADPTRTYSTQNWHVKPKNKASRGWQDKPAANDNGPVSRTAETTSRPDEDGFSTEDESEDENDDDAAPAWEGVGCKVCGIDSEDCLLCDGCDAPYHPKCLDPPLMAAPEGDW